jgi:hypothetical protein
LWTSRGTSFLLHHFQTCTTMLLEPSHLLIFLLALAVYVMSRTYARTCISYLPQHPDAFEFTSPWKWLQKEMIASSLCAKYTE